MFRLFWSCLVLSPIIIWFWVKFWKSISITASVIFHSQDLAFCPSHCADKITLGGDLEWICLGDLNRKKRPLIWPFPNESHKNNSFLFIVFFFIEPLYFINSCLEWTHKFNIPIFQVCRFHLQYNRAHNKMVWYTNYTFPNYKIVI